MRWPLRASASNSSSRVSSQRRLWLSALEFGLVIAALAVTRLLSIFLWLLPDGDVKEYHDYALAFWARYPIFHSLPVEYPPLAIVPFSLTLLPPIGDYHTIFAVWMGALVLLGYIGFLRFSTRRRAIIYTGYLFIGAAAVLLSRFDIVPALVTLAALWATERRRFGYAYALLAAGVLLKLYPGFLIPVVMVEQWHAATARAIAERRETVEGATSWWRGRPMAVLRQFWQRPATYRVVQGIWLCGGLIVLGFAGALLLSPSGALSGFGYAGQRPMQIESTPASILWLGTLLGIPAHPDYSFVSLNYVGVLDALLKPLSALALVGGCLWVYWRQACGRLTVGRAFTACLCAVLVTNKIFSPQYLIWVLPVVAYVEGFDVLWVAICVLTTYDFPIIYQMRHPIWTVPYTMQFMPVLALRNGLLLWATLRVVLRHQEPTVAPADLAPAMESAPLMIGQSDEREGPEPALAGRVER